MLGLQLVTIHPAAVFLVKNGVGRVQVHLLHAGAQLQYQINVRHQLFGGTGTARIVARGLNAAGQGLVGIGVKAAHVVALPAMQTQGRMAQLLKGGFHIYAIGRIALLGICKLITHVRFLLFVVCLGV